MNHAARCAAASLALVAHAGAEDKSPYTLLNPTPKDLRRPLSADRPDATESPYTVDAGAVQVELSFVEHAWGGANGAEATSVAPMNLKLGLTNSIDVQLLLNPYERLDDGEGEQSGFGGLGLRAKFNLWGNDGGPSAGALLPYIVLPVGDRDVSPGEVEFGLVVPVSLELPGGWGLGVQGEIAGVEGDGGHDLLLAHTAALGRDITDRLGGYGEYIGEVGFDGDDEYRPSVAAGLIYALSNDAQLDAGVVIGLDDPDTQDARLFIGLTLRY